MFVEQILAFAKIYLNVDEEIKKGARRIEKEGLKPIDALHIATAQAAEVDFFITCDYNLVRRCKGILKIVSPLEFLKYHEDDNQN